MAFLHSPWARCEPLEAEPFESLRSTRFQPLPVAPACVGPYANIVVSSSHHRHGSGMHCTSGQPYASAIHASSGCSGALGGSWLGWYMLAIATHRNEDAFRPDHLARRRASVCGRTLAHSV